MFVKSTKPQTATLSSSSFSSTSFSSASASASASFFSSCPANMGVDVDDFISANASGIKRDRLTQQSQAVDCTPFEELRKIILETEEDVLLELLETNFETGKMFDYVRAIGTGFHLLIDLKEYPKKMKLLRFRLVEKVIQLLGAHRLPNQTASKLTSSLIGLVDQLSVVEQVELSELILNNFKDDPSFFQGCLFLPPLLFNILHQGENVAFGYISTSSEMNPSEFRTKYFEILLSLDWDPAVAIPFCEMFRDLSLSEKELTAAIQKLSEVWISLLPQDIPGAVQNLLLLSTKGSKALILHQIVSFFDSKSRNGIGEKESVEMKQIEGTAALQINFAVKQDQNIGKQYLNFLKKTNPPLTPFLLGLLLSLARISCFHQLAFDIMKSSLSNTSSISGRTAGSPWLTEFVQPVEILSPENNRAMLKKIITGSGGWDHILPSIVELGISLLECHFPRSDVTNSVVDLGRFLLFETFRSHQHVQSEILGQIASRVLTNADHVERHLSLLSQLVKEVPQDVRSHSSQVKEAFDYLTQLPETTAISLIHSVLPLVCIDSEFQNYVILVLRKAMFNSQVSARLSATEGFLSILEELCKLDSSDNSLSQSSTQRPPSYDRTFVEILGILRRSTTQQTEIRCHLYRRMASICDDLPRSLYPPFFSILYTQLEKYYPDGGTLDICLALDGSRLLKGKNPLAVRQIEPLGNLVQCIGQCVSLTCHEGAEEMIESEVIPIHFKLEKKMNSLLQYLLETDPQTLKAPPSTSMSIEAEKQYRTDVMIVLRNIYKAAIETALLFRPNEEQTLSDILRYFSHYHAVPNNSSPSQPSSVQPPSAPEKEKGKGGRKGPKPKNSLPFGLCLSIPVIDHLLGLYHEQLQEIIQVNATQGLTPRGKDFLRFIILNCYHNHHFSATRLGREKLPLKGVRSICKFLVEEFQADWKTVKSSPSKQSVPCFCLDTFLMILEDGRRRGPDIALSLLSVWDPEGEKKKISELLPRVLASLSRVSREKFSRESGLLLKLLGLMLDEMSFSEVKEYALAPSEPHYSHLLHYQLPPSIVRRYMRFLSRLAHFSIDLMEKIVESLRAAVGSIYEGPETGAETSEFQMIVSDKEGAFFALLMTDSLDMMLDEVDYSVGFFLEDKKDGGGNDPMNQQQQQAICDRLLVIQMLLVNLATCGVQGPPSDGILKVLTKFYRVQTKVSRKFLSFDPEKVCPTIISVVKKSLKMKNEVTDLVVFLETNTPSEGISEANLKKRSQLKPNLTFMFEQYQAVVLKLAKRTKFKLRLPRSRARDFKISKKRSMEEEEEEEEEGEGEEEVEEEEEEKVMEEVEEEEEGELPPKKRRKKGEA